MQIRVLMVLESVFPATGGGGGAERQVAIVAAQLLARGIPVSVIAPRLPYGGQAVDDQLDAIPIRRIAYPRIPLLGGVVMLTRLAWRLFRLRHDYTVIHAHIAGNMAALCCVMGRWLGKPVLVKLTGMTEMVGGIIDPAAAQQTRLKRAGLRHATYYQATSLQIANMLAAAGFAPSKIHHIPNAVDTQRFGRPPDRAAQRMALCGDKNFVAVYVGRLEPEKDLELLLQGWAAAIGQRSDASLLVLGGGSLQAPLQALAQQLGVDHQVIFIGPTSQVPHYMGLADIGLLTSKAEGLSNTLLEYMASGLPVIGTQVSGTEDFVITGQTGWLFPVSDQAQFQACLTQAAELGAGRLVELGRQAQNKVVAQASMGAVLERLLGLYRGHR
jgi:L-malate glycosyltransferase